MAIQVVIKRDVKQGRQAKELVPLILQMRASAMYQPGYISGETWCDMEHPGECIVISKWESIEDWNKWVRNQTRMMIDQKIETLTGEKSEYRIYSSMTPQPRVEKEPKRQAGHN